MPCSTANLNTQISESVSLNLPACSDFILILHLCSDRWTSPRQVSLAGWEGSLGAGPAGSRQTTRSGYPTAKRRSACVPRPQPRPPPPPPLPPPLLSSQSPHLLRHPDMPPPLHPLPTVTGRTSAQRESC